MVRISIMVALSLALTGSSSAQITSPPPANVMLVVCPSGYFLTRHPKLPVLYVGAYSAPESKNLITLPLNPDGSVNTNGIRAYNYFSENPTNALWGYSVQKPIVLAEEQVLLLGAVPSRPEFFAHTNHQEIAAVALDESGQPGRVLTALRTTHGEKEIRGWQFDPTTRRLYISYHTYFGWISVRADGLPENGRFTLIPGIQTCWQWIDAPDWKRFFARQTDSGLVAFKLTADGTAAEIIQSFTNPYRGIGNLALGREYGKLYFLDTLGGRVAIYRVTKDGRVTGSPRFSSVGAAHGLRFDFKARKMYAWYDKALLRSFPLDDQGNPIASSDLYSLNCGGIRDVLLDDPGGRLYVLCTEAPAAK